jgi:hypothetical protein
MKKKSLIESLKATRKANVVTAPAKNEGTSTRKIKMTAGRKSTVNFGKMRPAE